MGTLFLKKGEKYTVVSKTDASINGAGKTGLLLLLLLLLLSRFSRVRLCATT